MVINMIIAFTLSAVMAAIFTPLTIKLAKKIGIMDIPNDARKIQKERYKNTGILTNSQLTADMVKKYCQIDNASKEILKLAVAKYQLSGRRYDRVLKLSRTIADLDNSEIIKTKHITQALQYRFSEQMN